jgi:hypothetical protein
MVSLTKGEGFGRPLLEFSLLNKPIIASGWSGHTDFLKPGMSILISGELENIHPSSVNKWLLAESKWFKPSNAEIGKHLKEVYNNYPKYILGAKKQKNYSQSNFSFKKMQTLIEDLLDKNIPLFPQEMILNLPKLKRIE